MYGQYSEGLETFSFSVVNSSLCFSYAEFIAIPATSSVDNLRHLRAIQAVLSWKEGLDVACALKYEVSDSSGRTNTQGLKITEENELSLQ